MGFKPETLNSDENPEPSEVADLSNLKTTANKSAHTEPPILPIKRFRSPRHLR
jgi:hypothetical protein